VKKTTATPMSKIYKIWSWQPSGFRNISNALVPGIVTQTNQTNRVGGGWQLVGGWLVVGGR